MNKSITFEILKKLSRTEVNQLTAFVTSPYFNQSKRIVDTLAYCINCLKQQIPPNKMDLHEYLFGEESLFNDHKIRLLLSDLLKLVESFIFHQSYQKDKITQQLKLAKFYRENDLEKHFNRVQRKVERIIDSTPIRNHQYFADKNQLAWEAYEWSSSKKRDIDVNLQKMGQNLDIAYFSTKLRQACFLKAQQAVYDIEYDFQWVDQILQHIQQKGWQAIPTISLYYNAYQLSTQAEKITAFSNLKQQIFEYDHILPIAEIKDIYLLAINFCIKKVNNGQKEFAEESLNLYKKGLEIGCFLEKGFLSKFTYANIVAFGLMSKDFNWTNQFIESYKSKLDKSSRNSAYAFNMARLRYVKDKDYETALSFLQKVSDKDLLNTLNAKILQLRIYWEIEAFNLLDSHLEAMANFIRRKEVIGYHKENYLNIINFTKRLSKVNFYDQKEVEKLKIAIEAERILSEKLWLLQQLSAKK